MKSRPMRRNLRRLSETGEVGKDLGIGQFFIGNRANFKAFHAQTDRLFTPIAAMHFDGAARCDYFEGEFSDSAHGFGSRPLEIPTLT
jgi:hypothetical protein